MTSNRHKGKNDKRKKCSFLQQSDSHQMNIADLFKKQLQGKKSVEEKQGTAESDVLFIKEESCSSYFLRQKSNPTSKEQKVDEVCEDHHAVRDEVPRLGRLSLKKSNWTSKEQKVDEVCEDHHAVKDKVPRLGRLSMRKSSNVTDVQKKQLINDCPRNDTCSQSSCFDLPTICSQNGKAFNHSKFQNSKIDKAEIIEHSQFPNANDLLGKETYSGINKRYNKCSVQVQNSELLSVLEKDSEVSDFRERLSLRLPQITGNEVPCKKQKLSKSGAKNVIIPHDIKKIEKNIHSCISCNIMHEMKKPNNISSSLCKFGNQLCDGDKKDYLEQEKSGTDMKKQTDVSSSLQKDKTQLHDSDLEDGSEQEKDSIDMVESNELKVSYYLENFRVILKSVLEDAGNLRLFNESDLQSVTSFYNLSEEAQKLYVRLISRKLAWLPLSRINYPEISKDLTHCFQELVLSGLVNSDEQLNELLPVLGVLATPHLRTLAKTYHLNINRQQKRHIIQSLFNISQQNSVATMFGQNVGNAVQIMINSS